MRYCKDIAITKAIMHVIDRNADEPLLGNELIELEQETYMYLHNHIDKALNSDSNNRGEFLTNNTTVFKAFDAIFDDGDFLGHSKKIAEHLFKTVKQTLGAPSGDLIILECIIEGVKVIGVLFMEYKTSFTHDITFAETEFVVNLKAQTISLPPKGQRLSRCAFFSESSLLDRSNKSYDLVMMEKPNYDENGESVEFFKDDFLQATIILDNTDITRIIRIGIEKWLRKNCKENINKAIEARLNIDEQYISGVEIDIKEMVTEVIESIEEKEKFLMALEKAGVDTDQAFEIDKKYVNKKLRKKTIITDTGFSIKGDYELFEDASRLDIQYNGDGTVNYILKQVRNIKQS